MSWLPFSSVLIEAVRPELEPAVIVTQFCWPAESIVTVLGIDASRYDRGRLTTRSTLHAGPIVINRRIDRFVSPRPFTWESVGVAHLLGALHAGITCLLDYSHVTKSAEIADAAVRGHLDSGDISQGSAPHAS